MKEPRTKAMDEHNIKTNDYKNRDFMTKTVQWCGVVIVSAGVLGIAIYPVEKV